jgi:hypothetical protein
VRLGTCIAIELGVGASTIALVAFAGLWGTAELRRGFSRDAEASDVLARVAHPPAEWPRLVDLRGPAADVTSPRRPRPGEGQFGGQADADLLAPLRSGQIAEVKFNRGGSSISLRIDFDNGARAAFKPDQTNLQTVPRKEVAAYRVARLLGLGQVAPAIGRRFAIDDIRAHLAPESASQWPRFVAEVPGEGGFVDGELSFWIPSIENAKIGGLTIDSTDGILTWKRLLTVGNPIPESDLVLAAQLSDMVLFDYLINNSDRWSGNNTKMSSDGATLYFMDNALSFGHDRRGHSRVRIYFERSQKFSRRLVDRLRALDEASLREAVSWDVEPFPFLLDDGDIAALFARREALLAALDRLIAQHGEDAVLVFP